ncbi:MAG TPA: hypothetical protein VGC80_12895, partial [Acetobacteraceae bacterium]
MPFDLAALTWPDAGRLNSPVAPPTRYGDGAKGSDHEFTFSDALDVINPLQHLPVVSTIYRAVTGDKISSQARILGDTLYGGPVGGILGAINAMIEEVGGKDLGAMVVAALQSPFVDKTDPTPATDPQQPATPSSLAPASQLAEASVKDGAAVTAAVAQTPEQPAAQPAAQSAARSVVQSAQQAESQAAAPKPEQQTPQAL